MSHEVMLPLAAEYVTEHPVALGTPVQFRRRLHRLTEPTKAPLGERRTWAPRGGDDAWQDGVVVGVRVIQDGLTEWGSGMWRLVESHTVYLVAYSLRRAPVYVRFQDVRAQVVSDG